MRTSFVRQLDSNCWTIGNDRFECSLTADRRSGTLRLQGTDGLEGWLPTPAIQVEVNTVRICHCVRHLNNNWIMW